MKNLEFGHCCDRFWLGKINISKAELVAGVKFHRYKLFPFLFSLLVLLSCSSAKLTPQGRIVKDTYSRTYAVEFTSFHARINNALQDYARKHKGNAFQVARLGGDAVVIQGRYKRDGEADRFFATLTVKSEGKQKTAIHIKLSSSNPEAASEYLAAAAADLFRIVETGAGVPAGE